VDDVGRLAVLLAKLGELAVELFVLDLPDLAVLRLQDVVLGVVDDIRSSRAPYDEQSRNNRQTDFHFHRFSFHGLADQRTVDLGVGLGRGELLLGRGALLRLLLELICQIFDNLCGCRVTDLWVHAPDVGPLAGVFDDDTVTYVDLQLIGDDLDGAARDLDRIHHPHLLGTGCGSNHRARGGADGRVATTLVARRTTRNEAHGPTHLGALGGLSAPRPVLH
jgi:hypothetical protein